MIGRAAEHDVRRTAHVEAVARARSLPCTPRPRPQGRRLQNQDPPTRFRQVAGADQAVVPGTDDDAVVNRGHVSEK